jgi:hypothetical protein
MQRGFSYPMGYDARVRQWASPLVGDGHAAVVNWDAQPSFVDRLVLGLALWAMLGLLAVGVLSFRYLSQILAIGASLTIVVLVALSFH